MTMTRQDFEFIADALRRARECVERYAPGLQLLQYDELFLPSVADDLAKANPRFDRARFLKACGVAS